MGKSSSSIKKKSSRSSSKGQARKKSKTRKSKSKKLRRRDDSTDYSDDNSRSSMSVSSSSSEDGYINRRSRSSTRKDAKGSKKKGRSRMRSSSSEESPRVRKRKGSKRNDDDEVRRKRHVKMKKKKKKANRDASISSRSSGSWSCSTCRSPNDGGDDSEYVRHRGRSGRRDGDKRRSETKSRTKRRRYRSRSSSSFSKHSASSDYWDQEKVTSENTSKRLKSVITLINKDMEGSDFEKDEHKEELVYDHDDYPSSRSNDSNDGGNKKDSANQPYLLSEMERPIEDDKRDDFVASKVKATMESDKDGAGEYGLSRHKSGKVREQDVVNEGKDGASGAVGGAGGDDLESILRQKALENLRRFRGGIQTTATAPANQKDESDNAVKLSSQDDEKITDRKNAGFESGSAKNDMCPPGDPDPATAAGREKFDTTASSNSRKPRFVTTGLRQAFSNTTTTPTPAPASQESNKAKLVMVNSVGKSAAQAACTATPPSGNSNDIKPNNASASGSAEPTSNLTSAGRDIGSDKLQDEGKDRSQLEQRTMSVMRGGEMVQVSYKVYIPKKAPARTRRKLER